MLSFLKMARQAKFPEGWNEKRVQEVLAHHETQTEAVAEDEAMDEEGTEMAMEIHKTNSESFSMIPTRSTLMRALVSAIPYVGGALDHLLFDRADEIRVRNIEVAIQNIDERIGELDNKSLNIDWFQSEEALAMFRLMAECVQFEPDKEKSKLLAQLVVASSTDELSKDAGKLSVFQHVSRLSYVQLKLLKIVARLQPMERKLHSAGGITQVVTALWVDQIKDAVQNNPDGQFWNGVMVLDMELEVLASLNMLRSIQLFGSSTKDPYKITLLGDHAVRYLNETTA